MKYTVEAKNNGNVLWYKEGTNILHREDGPAIEYANGDKEWYQNGKKHRINGPAIDWANGWKFWYQNGKRHRLDGPAAEYSNGYKEYYIEGIEYSEEEFKAKINSDSCEGKVVYIDGKRYKLKLV